MLQNDSQDVEDYKKMQNDDRHNENYNKVMSEDNSKAMENKQIYANRFQRDARWSTNDATLEELVGLALM